MRRAARWVGCCLLLAASALAHTPYGVRFETFDPPTSIVSSTLSANFDAVLQADVTALLLYVDEVRAPGLVTLTIGNPVLKTGSVMVTTPGWVEFALTGVAPASSMTLPVQVSTSTADLTLRHLQVQWYGTDYPLGSNPNPTARLSRVGWGALITGVFRLASGADPLAEPGCGDAGAVSGSPYVFGEWMSLDAGSLEQITVDTASYPGFLGLWRFDPAFRGLPDWSLGLADGGSQPIGYSVLPHPPIVQDTWPRPGLSPPFRMIASGAGDWLRLNAGPGLDVCHPAVRATFGGHRARAVGAAPGTDFVITTVLREGYRLCRDTDGDGYGTDCQMIVSSGGAGWVQNEGDCDETNAAINPGAPERCDSLDNDCDSLIDADDPQLERPLCANQTGLCLLSRNTPSTCVNGAFLACTDASYGPSFGRSEAMCGSLDFNCDGVISRAIPCALQAGVCSGVTFTDCTPGASCGRNEYGPDFEVNETRCDGLDNDCDGTPDDVPMKSCTLQLGVCAGATTTPELCLTTGFAECGADQYGPDWEAVERSCDGKDNDCDGFTDAFDTGCELQRGVCAGAQHLSPRCNADTLETCGGADYGPTWEAVEQRCDRLDNDCDGVTDEGCGQADGGGEANVPPTGCGCGAIDSFLLLSALVFLVRRRRITGLHPQA